MKTKVALLGEIELWIALWNVDYYFLYVEKISSYIDRIIYIGTVRL